MSYLGSPLSLAAAPVFSNRKKNIPNWRPRQSLLVVWQWELQTVVLYGSRKLLEISLIGVVGNSLVHPFSNMVHVILLHAACSDSRSAKTQTRWVKGLTGVIRDGILVSGQMNLIESSF